MNHYEVPESVKNAVLRRKGKLFSIERFDMARTALVVIDMQNHFVAPGFLSEVPEARGIVPNINRLAKAVRAQGGAVAWVQTTATGATEHWPNHHLYGMTPERAKQRLASMDESAEGFKLWPELETVESDLFATKIMFSAMLPTSSNLHSVLNTRGIDMLMIAGTTTNVCCESTARDAMMMDYRVAMISDACATRGDAEHAASLNNFQSFFGDVMTAEQALSRMGAA